MAGSPFIIVKQAQWLLRLPDSRNILLHVFHVKVFFTEETTFTLRGNPSVRIGDLIFRIAVVSEIRISRFRREDHSDPTAPETEGLPFVATVQLRGVIGRRRRFPGWEVLSPKPWNAVI
jgi:hypothetical protein